MGRGSTGAGVSGAARRTTGTPVLPQGKRDDLTAQHWKDQVTVNRGRYGDALTQGIFGKILTDREIGRLVGAPDGSTITMTRMLNGELHLKVEHPWVGIMTRSVWKEGDGSIQMKNILLELNDSAPKGAGTRIFAQQRNQARKLGVEYINTDAIGRKGADHNGYYTWARLGYDGDIPPAVRSRMPAQFRDYETVHEIMLLGGREGREWWKEHGDSFEGYFDLSRGSISNQVLDKYMEIRGIKV
jgi:hypothetical protein